MTKEQVKHVMLSILIGATVSFMTVLFQGILDVLKGISPETIGVMAGLGKYISTLKSPFFHV